MYEHTGTERSYCDPIDDMTVDASTSSTELRWWPSALPQAKGSVLLVDPDQQVCEEIAATLSAQGVTVHTTAAPSGPAVLTLASRLHPDVIVMEVDLPDMDGFDVIRQLHAQFFDGATVFLTARNATSSKIEGLTIGAADYITKPYSAAEVAVRLRSIMRRTRRDTDAPGPDRRVVVADVALDPAKHQVWKAGVTIALSPTEFRLLYHLLSHPNTVLTHANIIEHVWQGDQSIDRNVIRTYVKYLRTKLDITDSDLIHTVRGVGYVVRSPLR